MITIVEVLQRLGGKPDRITLEEYIAHTWVRPIKEQEIWYFEEIDIARIQLLHQLRYDMMVGDEAMDVVLHLLDQLYSLREQIRRLKDESPHVQSELRSLLGKMINTGIKT